MTSSRRFDPAGLVAGILLLVFAGLIVWDMNRLQIAAFYGIGPKAMPYAVAGGMALLGLGNLVLAIQGGFPERESLDTGRVFLILGALVALIGIIGLGIGFIPAATILFAAVARAFEEAPISTLVRYGLMAVVSLLVLTIILGLLGAPLPAVIANGLVVLNLVLLGAALLNRRGALNLAIGFAISFVAYLLFAKLLALTLPAGPLERLF